MSAPNAGRVREAMERRAAARHLSREYGMSDSPNGADFDAIVEVLRHALETIIDVDEGGYLALDGSSGEAARAYLAALDGDTQ